MMVDIATTSLEARMDQDIRQALSHPQAIDITTTGRTSGQPRRIEIVFHVFDGHIYISGMPRADRQRDWLRNLESDPHMTFHLKGQVTANLAAMARVISDPAERRQMLPRIARVWRRDPEEMIRYSPLIEVTIPGYEVAAAA
jgi:deazaflavin-dependent oxidoreductase (nitroreductase family)